MHALHEPLLRGSDRAGPATGVLEGKRVRLRPYAHGFSEPELERLYRWGCDTSLAALAGGVPLTLPYARFREAFLEQLMQHNTPEEQLFAVLDEAGTLIGRCGLFGMLPGKKAAELGIVIGDAEAWGRGHGRDATRVLAAFGLGSLGLDRIYLYTYDDNHRAQRAFMAAGFRVVREMRRFSLERGTHAEIEMEIRKTET